MRALVTGGAGFIGANLVRELIVDGVEVRVLAREGSDLRNLIGLDIELSHGDVRSFESVRDACKGCDQVFHVAGYYSIREADGKVMYEVNVDGTKNVLRVAQTLGVTKVVHTSTIGTVGRPDGPVSPNETCEFNIWDSATHYAKSKYLGEKAALEAAAGGLPVVVVNPCAPVGPFDSKPSATGQRIVDFLAGRWPSFLSGGINFVDVADVCRGHILAASKGRVGERYILGNKNLTYHGFLAIMREVSGQKGPRLGKLAMVRSIARRVSLGRRGSAKEPGRALTCDCTKAISELGLPQTPLEIAFARSVRWYRENGYVDSAGLVEGA